MLENTNDKINTTAAPEAPAQEANPSEKKNSDYKVILWTLLVIAVVAVAAYFLLNRAAIKGLLPYEIQWGDNSTAIMLKDEHVKETSVDENGDVFAVEDMKTLDRNEVIPFITGPIDDEVMVKYEFGKEDALKSYVILVSFLTENEKDVMSGVLEHYNQLFHANEEVQETLMGTLKIRTASWEDKTSTAEFKSFRTGTISSMLMITISKK